MVVRFVFEVRGLVQLLAQRAGRGCVGVLCGYGGDGDGVRDTDSLGGGDDEHNLVSR